MAGLAGAVGDAEPVPRVDGADLRFPAAPIASAKAWAMLLARMAAAPTRPTVRRHASGDQRAGRGGLARADRPDGAANRYPRNGRTGLALAIGRNQSGLQVRHAGALGRDPSTR